MFEYIGICRISDIRTKISSKTLYIESLLDYKHNLRLVKGKIDKDERWLMEDVRVSILL